MDHNQKLFIGMDLHKNTSTFAVKDKDGNVIDRKKISTEPSAIKDYLSEFSNASLAVEPVSQWYFYADLIQKLGIDVHLANPLKVKAIASARIKTDTIDAGVLCDLLRTNLLPEAYFASTDIRFWKEMVRFRASLIHLRTQVKNKIHSILFKNALRHDFSDLFGVAGRKWLESLALEEPFAFNLKHYLALMDMLKMLIDEADHKIERMVTDHPQARLLTSIPGISYCSALTIMAEIGTIDRFSSSPKKLMSYAGLVPSTYASGEKTRHGHITKQGSRWLRWTMIEIAQRQLLCKNKPGFSWYYNRIKQRKGSSVAAVATARKLLAVIWRMLKDNRAFEAIPPKREVQVAHLTTIVSR
jgi:transposase